MGDGIRARRRNNKTFVWGLYTIGKVIDESTGGTSGSVTLSSSRYKMVSSAYTVSSTGTISLTNAAQKTAANIAVGDYLVNISTSNNTSTTGSTLYKVTNVTKSGTSHTISYVAYTSIDAVGTDTGNRIESKTLDYPVDGIYNGYWYVLLRGKTTIHVWNIHNISYQDNWVTKSESRFTASLYSSSAVIYYSASYEIPRSYPNQLQLVDASQSVCTTFTGWNNYYWLDGGSKGNYIYKGGTYDASYGSRVNNTTRYYQVNEQIAQKGTATGKTVLSAAKNIYPSNGVSGSYWYVYSHSYEGYIDLT